MGWAYSIACLGAATAGFILSLRTSTGTVSGAAFGLLAVAWAATTVLAVITAIQRKIAEHRRWAIRSYALTLAGLTLRVYLTIALVAHAPMPTAYLWIAWGCWIPNLMVALLVTRRSAKKIDLPAA